MTQDFKVVHRERERWKRKNGTQWKVIGADVWTKREDPDLEARSQNQTRFQKLGGFCCYPNKTE